MTGPEFKTVTADFPRDRFGRPMIIPPGGGKPTAYTRATTYVGVLEDTYNLSKWSQRMVASGISQRPDLHLRAASLGLQPQDKEKKREWKRDMDEVTEKAVEAAKASAAATVGTAVHALTEQIDRGQEIGAIPDQYRKHLEAYERATAEFTALYIEQKVVLDQLKIGGTPDRVLQVPGSEKLIIGDIKTGDTDFGVLKMAMQLAVYAHSVLYNPADGARAPIGDVDLERGLIIALSADTGLCEPFWIDIGTGWDAVKTAGDVRFWRQQDKKGKLTERFTPAGQQTLDVGPPPAPKLAAVPDPQPLVSITPDTAMVKVITRASSVEELVQIWTQAEQQGLWTEDHTRLAAKRRSELQASA